MGELSKTVGEYGESTVESFLKLIGWGEVPKNISITCAKPNKHNEKGTDSRQTHGIDFLFSYECPLHDEIIKNIIVSSKFTSKPYPSSAVGKFKEYFHDLATTLDCFKFSKKQHTITPGNSGRNKGEDVGVLFWLSNDKSGNGDLISKIEKAQFNNDYAFGAIYVVDNKRIEFIFKTIEHVKIKFPIAEIQFYYPNTGKNLNPLMRKSNGPILPVEYINTSVLPLRIETRHEGTSEVVLLLSVIDNFSDTDFKRLLGLAQSICENWASRAIITFPDYNPLEHDHLIREVKLSFANASFTNNITVSSFNGNFTQLKS